MHIDPRAFRLALAAAASAGLLAACGGGSDSKVAAATERSATASAAAPIAVDGTEGKGKATRNGVYIVQMADLPVTAYDGRTRGFAATKPA